MSSYRRLVRAVAFAAGLLLSQRGGLVVPARAQQLQLRSAPPLPYPEGEAAVVDVTLVIVVDEQGRVADVHVHEKRPADAPASFDAASLAFGKALQFEPVVVNGRPTRIQTEVPLHFAPPAAQPTDEKPNNYKALPTTDRAEPTVVDVGRVPSLSARVTATRAPVAVGDLHLHLGQLGDVPRGGATGMLQLAPGILLTNHGGEGHAPAIFLRGFDAGEGQDLEFRLDGIPLNEVSNAHAHGYADTHFIVPELVDELRVVEGPFDPRQGDFAAAGSVEYHLGLHERGLRIKAAAGNFDAGRLLLLWGPPGQEQGTFAAVEMKRGGGFGVNRAYEGASAMAQYEARPAPGTTLTLLGQSAASLFDSAGVLREEDFQARRIRGCTADADSQFFCTYDPAQGGATSRHGLSARLVHRLGRDTLEQQLFVARRELRILDNFTGFASDRPTGAGQEQRGDLSEKLYGATTAGGRGSLLLKRRFWGLGQELEVGYVARHDAGSTVSRRLRADGGAPYQRDFDVEFSVTNLGAYAAGHLRVLPWLSVRGGLRADTFAFHALNLKTPEVDRQGRREPGSWRDAFGAVLQPRGSLVLRLGEGLDWITSAGAGARSSDVSALSDGEFAPFSAVRAGESGVSWEASGGEDGARWTLSTKGAAYWTWIERTLLFDPVAARNVPGRESHRFGAMALARVGLGSWLDAQASATYAEAYQPSLAASEPWSRLPYVPRWVLRLDSSVRRDVEVFGQEIECGAALGVTYIAPRPLPLDAFSDPIFTIDASVRARWHWVELAVSAQNLLDSRYRLAELNYVSNFDGPGAAETRRAARHFAAGAPRTVLATLTFRFDETGSDAGGHDVHEEEP
jgi:hypothetical protein